VTIEAKNTMGNPLGPWMGKTMKIIENRVEEIMAANGIDLSRMQFIILKNIDENEGVCQNELAFFANRNKSSLTRMINTLKTKGLIKRITCSEDKRRNTIHLTVKGQEIITKAKPHFKELITVMEQGISKEEKETTIKVLKHIQSNMKQGDPSPFFKEKL